MFKGTIFRWVIQHGYVGIFSLLMLGIVGVPVPDEVLLAFAGYLVYKGKLQLVPTIVTAFLGSICGITLSYWFGRTFGVYLTRKYSHRFHTTAKNMTTIHRMLERIGKWMLFFGYFLPGVRQLMAYIAGTSKLHLRVFMPFAYAGGFVWSVTFIMLGYYLGEKCSIVSEKIHYNVGVSSGIIITLVATYLILRKIKQTNGGKK